jgi:ribokinase
VSAPVPRADAAFDVCVVGSANLDLVVTASRIPHPGETVFGTDFHEYPGGKGLNQAVAAARCGARTAFIGAIGDDDAGHRLTKVLRDESIDTDGLTDVDAPTGRAIITVDSSGENSIVVVSGANGRVASDPPLPRSLVVLSQLEVPVPVIVSAFRRARYHGATTILNPAPALEFDDELVELTDIMVPNRHEVDALGGTRRLFALGCTAVVVTRGAEGVSVTTAERTWHQAAFAVRPVDTTGAGDAFCGALASRVAAGMDLRAAVRFAAAAGALATTQRGAVPAQPHLADVEALIAQSTDA